MVEPVFGDQVVTLRRGSPLDFVAYTCAVPTAMKSDYGLDSEAAMAKPFEHLTRAAQVNGWSRCVP
jgi:hypothetical protein